MDATTLYVIVMLANGVVRTGRRPAGERSAARRPRATFFRGRITNDYLRAGAKAVTLYCAPHSKTLVIAR